MNWREGKTGGSGAAWQGQVLLSGDFDWWVNVPGTGTGNGGSAGLEKTSGADIIVAGGGIGANGQTGGVVQTNFTFSDVVLQNTI